MLSFSCTVRAVACKSFRSFLSLYGFSCDTQGHFIEAIVNKEFYDEHVESGFPRADAEFEKHLEDGMALLIYKMKK